MRVVLSILAALFLSLSAQARLGESEAQLLERFGKPLKRGGMKPPAEGKSYVWKDDLAVSRAWLFNGNCTWIEYEPLSTKPYTSTEVQGILDANAGGFTWTPWKPGSKIWVRSDKQAVAEVEERKVTVYDVAFGKAVKAANDQAITDIEAAEAARKAEIQKRREERQAGGAKDAPAATSSRASKF